MTEPMDKAKFADTVREYTSNTATLIHQSLQDIIEMYGEDEINKVLDGFEPLPEDKEYINKLLHNKADYYL